MRTSSLSWSLSSTWASSSIACVALSAATLAAAAADGSAAAKPLRGRAYNAAALNVETALRAELGTPVRVDFHRDQAFEGGTASLRWRVLSIAWQREGETAHCVLAVDRGVAPGSTAPLRVDALEGEREAMPWSCDGAPALRFKDLDGDACPEVIALYPMRPPSGERFLWPLVLRCDGARGGEGPSTNRWSFDAARSGLLRKSLERGPLRSLRQAEALLAR